MHVGVMAAVLALATGTSNHRFGAYLDGLPACDSEPAVPADWKSVDAGYLLSFPLHCDRDPVPAGYPHGGERFLCAKATVELIWGYFGPASFAKDADMTICRTAVGTVPAIMFRSDRQRPRTSFELSVWYLVGSDFYEPAIRIRSTNPDDMAALTPIAFSLREKEKRK